MVRRQGRPGRRGRTESWPELVAWLDERAQEGRLRVWTSETDARIVSAFSGLGFAPVRHSYRMEIDLAGDRARARLAGRDLGSHRHRRRPPARLRRSRSRSGRTRTTRSTRRSRNGPTGTSSASRTTRELWFLAIAGDELAGFSICRQDSVDPTAGYVAMLGVRRPWRRQGLGEALLVHSFAEFRRRGYTRDARRRRVERRGATRLYERAGMSVTGTRCSSSGRFALEDEASATD